MKKIVLAFCIVIITSGFTISKRIDALIKKEITSVFQIDSYTQEIVKVSDSINETLPIKITDSNFFKIIHNEQLIGHYYFGQGYGKADYFDFIVIFDTNFIVSKVKVLAYREDHGGEIGSKRWLKQFIGATKENNLKYQEDIVGISGATISVKSMTNEINKLLKTISILAEKEQL